MSNHEGYRVARALILFILLTVTLPFSAFGSTVDECARHVALGAERAKAIEAVPALGHLTTVDGFMGMLRSGSIKTFQELHEANPRAKKNIGGVSQSVFLAPFFKSQTIRSGNVMLGPTLILSTSLLERNDYYFNDSWEEYGSFLSAMSVTAKDATLDSMLKGREFMFGNEISLKDYVVGAFIPASQRWEFELKSITLKGRLRALGIPVFYSDQLPSVEELRRLANSKRSPILKSQYSKDHPVVQMDLSYQFSDMNSLLSFAENPANRSTPMFAKIIKDLNRGFSLGGQRDFETQFRIVSLLLGANNCAPKWMQRLSSQNMDHVNRVRVDELLNAYGISAELQSVLRMPTDQLYTALDATGMHRFPGGMFAWARHPEDRSKLEYLMLMVGLDTDYYQIGIDQMDWHFQRARALLEGGFNAAYRVRSPGHIPTNDRQEELRKLLWEFGLK